MKTKLILLIIILIGLILRFVYLGEIPAGITSDEANTGYDAYSLLVTGKDQWGDFLPLTSFKGFGDFRSPLYTYMVVPFIVLFDLAALAVRLPSAISGVISILLIFLVTRKIFNERVGLAGAFFLSISPWAIGLSRQGIESNTAIALLLLAMFLFLKAKEKPVFLILSIFVFILTAYAYTSYILFAPLAIMVFAYSNKKLVIKHKRKALSAFLVLVIGFFPLFVFSSAGNTRLSQIGFLKDVTSIGLIDVLNQQIGSCTEGGLSVMCRIFNNKIETFASVFFQNYLHHFSFDFLYIKGTSTQFSLLYERGLLYLYEIIFLLFGIFAVLKSKKNLFLLLLLLLSAVPDSLSGGGHHSRASVMLVFLIIVQSKGLEFIYEYLIALKSKGVRVGILSAISLLILFSSLAFIINYFTYFKKHYSSYSLYAYQELSNKLFVYKDKYSDVFVSSYQNDAPNYIFYLFYNKYDPVKYQAKNDISYETSSTGFIKVTKIGNIKFTNFIIEDQIPEGIKGKEKALLIGSPDAFPKDIKNVKEFRDLSGGVIFQAVEYKELSKLD